METVSRSEDFIEHCNSLADQWLGLVISLASERCVAGVGRDMTERSSLRAEVILSIFIFYAQDKQMLADRSTKCMIFEIQ